MFGARRRTRRFATRVYATVINSEGPCENMHYNPDPLCVLPVSFPSVMLMTRDPKRTEVTKKLQKIKEGRGQQRHRYNVIVIGYRISISNHDRQPRSRTKD